jgi:hypothetical protein
MDTAGWLTVLLTLLPLGFALSISGVPLMQAAGSQEGASKKIIQLKDEIVKSCACSTAPTFSTIVV